MKRSRIILIGFMGSGKTWLGKKLAGIIGNVFFDLDELIEKETGLSVGEIFRRYGEETFRQSERNALLQVLHKERFVLAAGGGAPCYCDQMRMMNRAGLTIYLKCSPETLFSRLKHESQKRPLLRDKTDERLMTYIAGTLKQREPVYHQAGLILPADRLTPGELAEHIREWSPS
ncbi:MAG: shikimate kinase [Bacteroidales bacterium]